MTAEDHEMVSIYPFSDGQIDALMTLGRECVLMWGTKDGWPVGVTTPTYGTKDTCGLRFQHIAIALRPFAGIRESRWW